MYPLDVCTISNNTKNIFYSHFIRLLNPNTGYSVRSERKGESSRNNTEVTIGAWFYELVFLVCFRSGLENYIIASTMQPRLVRLPHSMGCHIASVRVL